MRKSVLCFHALEKKGTILVLRSYQKRQGRLKGSPMYTLNKFCRRTKNNFSRSLWALRLFDDIADKLGICFCPWQESVLKYYLIYSHCTVSFFFFNPRQFAVDSSFHFFLNIGTYDCIKLAAGSSADIF